MTGLIEQPTPEQLVDSLKLPTGYRAELIDGTIVGKPRPDEGHRQCVNKIAYGLSRFGRYQPQCTGLITPLGRFIPDVTVTTRDYWTHSAVERWQSTDDVVMVVEVTSSNSLTDREPKRIGYAAAGIPLYLLVDRELKESVLFSEPKHGDYAVTARRPIDEPIPLPEPFSFTLEDIR